MDPIKPYQTVRSGISERGSDDVLTFSQPPQLSPSNTAASVGNLTEVIAHAGPAPKNNGFCSGLKTFSKLVFLRVPAGALGVLTFGAAFGTSFAISSIACGAVSVPVGLLGPLILMDSDGLDGVIKMYSKTAKGSAWLGNHMSEGAGSLMRYAAQNKDTGDAFMEASKKANRICSILGGWTTGIPVVTTNFIIFCVISAPCCCCCADNSYHRHSRRHCY